MQEKRGRGRGKGRGRGRGRCSCYWPHATHALYHASPISLQSVKLSLV